MIPDRYFLRRCAQKNNLELPRELEDWLLVHFEDEPYENFNTASILEDMVCMYCQSFAYGRLDVTIPDPITRLKDEYSCAGVPLFRRNGYRQSGGRKPLFRNRDTALT